MATNPKPETYPKPLFLGEILRNHTNEGVVQIALAIRPQVISQSFPVIGLWRPLQLAWIFSEYNDEINDIHTEGWLS
eukprot:93124-Amorphochlora_amoeboformis.AAC.1